MSVVFIGGSRHLGRLNNSIREKLHELVERHLPIVIGDANGADKAVQSQLSEWNYPAVTVHFTGLKPRNNVGHWPTQRTDAPPSARGAAFYAAKDRTMAHQASYGLMIWDGESTGTLANVEHLLRDKKPVALYVSKLRKFVSLRALEDLAGVPLPPSEAARLSRILTSTSQSELPLASPQIEPSEARTGYSHHHR